MTQKRTVVNTKVLIRSQLEINKKNTCGIFVLLYPEWHSDSCILSQPLFYKENRETDGIYTSAFSREDISNLIKATV